MPTASSTRGGSAHSPAIISTPAPAGSRSASTPRSSRSARSGFIGRCSNSRCGRRPNGRAIPPIMIAGLVGRTAQAVQEAQLARDLGYHAGLLSLAAMKGAQRGRTDRARADGRAGNSAGRLLSAARRRRHRAAGVVLAALRRDRERRGDQDRAVQPLSHARRGSRRGRGGRRRSRHALYRQRRPHRARPGDAVRDADPRNGPS